MAGILHIETSTDVCSVAVSKDRFVVFEKMDAGDGKSHGTAAEGLGLLIDEALQTAAANDVELDAVAVSSGPGSYTGLRIGVSMAKGICYGKDLKLVSVPTLQLLCVPVLLRDTVTYKVLQDGEVTEHTVEMEDDALLCPMIDARRMEVYAEIFNRALKTVREIQADIVTAETYRELLDRGVVYFFGNGAMKCMETINHPNARFIEGIVPVAKNMMTLAEMRMMRGETEDVAYFVPKYFKDYVAKMPKSFLKND